MNAAQLTVVLDEKGPAFRPSDCVATRENGADRDHIHVAVTRSIAIPTGSNP